MLLGFKGRGWKTQLYDLFCVFGNKNLKIKKLQKAIRNVWIKGVEGRRGFIGITKFFIFAFVWHLYNETLK